MFSFYREVTSFIYSNINDRWQETYYFPSTKEMKKMDKLVVFKRPAFYQHFYFNDVQLTLEQHGS